MADLGQLNRVKPVTTTIDMGDGDQIRITFDRNRMTSEWDSRVQASPGFAKGLAEIILSWDVTENGQPLTPDEQSIGRLSIPAQGSLFRQLVEASMPGRAEGNGSTNTSATPSEGFISEPASPPNGQEPSPSLQPSASQSTT